MAEATCPSDLSLDPKAKKDGKETPQSALNRSLEESHKGVSTTDGCPLDPVIGPVIPSVDGIKGGQGMQTDLQVVGQLSPAFLCQHKPIANMDESILGTPVDSPSDCTSELKNIKECESDLVGKSLMRSGVGTDIEVDKGKTIVFHAFISKDDWIVNRKDASQDLTIKICTFVDNWMANIAEVKASNTCSDLEGRPKYLKVTAVCKFTEADLKYKVYYKYHVFQETKKSWSKEYLDWSGKLSRVLTSSLIDERFMDAQGQYHRYDDFILPKLDPSAPWYTKPVTILKHNLGYLPPSDVHVRHRKLAVELYLHMYNPILANDTCALFKILDVISNIFHQLTDQVIGSEKSMHTREDKELLKEELVRCLFTEEFFKQIADCHSNVLDLKSVIRRHSEIFARLQMIYALGTQNDFQLCMPDKEIWLVANALHLDCSDEHLLHFEDHLQYPEEIVKREKTSQCLKQFFLLLIRQQKFPNGCKCLDALVLLINFYTTSMAEVNIHHIFKQEELDIVQSKFNDYISTNPKVWCQKMLTSAKLISGSRIATLVLHTLPIQCWPDLVDDCPLHSLITVLEGRLTSSNFGNGDPKKIQYLNEFLDKACIHLRDKQSTKLCHMQYPEPKKCFDLAMLLLNTLPTDWEVLHKANSFCLLALGHSQEVYTATLEQAEDIVYKLAMKVWKQSSDYVLIPGKVKLWITILNYNCPKEVFNKWQNLILQSIEDELSQAHRMTDSECDLLSVMRIAEGLPCPTALEDCIFASIVGWFQVIKDKDHRVFLAHASELKNFRRLLKELLNMKYSGCKSISLDNLCSNVLWKSGMEEFQLDDPDIPTILNETHTFLQRTIEGVLKRTVTVGDVQWLTENDQNQSNFQQLVHLYCPSEVSAAKEDCDHYVTKVMGNLQEMKDVIKSYHSNKSLLLYIVDHCESFFGREGKDDCRKIKALSSCEIRNVPLHQLPSHLSTYCSHAEVVLKQCIYFKTVFEKPCEIINHLWAATCGPLVPNFKDLAEVTWPKFMKRLTDLVEKMSTLKLPCAEALKLLSPETVKKELNELLCVLHKCNTMPNTKETSDAKWMELVRSKVNLLHRMKGLSSEAAQLLEIKAALGLTGCFMIVQEIQHSVDSEWPLSRLDDNLQNVVQFVESHSVDLVSGSLATFAKLWSTCSELINWLRDEMKDVRDLQRFTSIALMTHCEDGPSLDKMTILEKMGTKLAPLIYELDAHANEHSFIFCFEKVESKLIPEISKNLEFCHGHLSWYKSVQSMLTSTEETAFSQLKNLTEHGVFTVAANADKSVPKGIKELVSVIIEDSTKAVDRTATEDSATTEGNTTTVYCLDDLQDLQSRLALINFRGNITEPEIQSMAQCFWNGMQLTANIANTLLCLLSVGHTKYQNCCCTYSLSTDCLEKLDRIAKGMMDDLEKWKKNIHSMRLKYYELNCYTSLQLSLIGDELASYVQADQITHFSQRFVRLIQSMFPAAHERRMAMSAEQVFKRRMSLPESDSDCMYEANAETAPVIVIKTPSMLNESELKIFERLHTLEYPEKIILMGITQNGPDFHAVEMFCLSNENSEDRQSDSESENEEKQSSHAEVDNMAQRLQGSGFNVKIAFKAAGQFRDFDKAHSYCIEQEQQNSSTVNDLELECVQTLPKFHVNPRDAIWHLEDIGEFLHDIAAYRHCTDCQLIKESRTFPSTFFNTTSPNVLSVPRSSIIQVIMTIYMYSEYLPLPKPGEVLCSHQGTTCEEISLLWRRAINDPEQRRIFILVCEHNLPYNIVKEAINELRNQIQGKSGYRLVIVCSQEDEHNSLLMSDLREYKQNCPPLQRPECIQKYLQTHFIGLTKEYFAKKHFCDPLQGSHVRVVSSRESGMGKSLYVQRLLEMCHAADHKWEHKIVPLHGPDVKRDEVVNILLEVKGNAHSHILCHLDISQNVIDEIGFLLFDVLILQFLHDCEGKVWRGSSENLYVVEITMPHANNDKQLSCSRNFLHMLPLAECLPPKDCQSNDLPQLGCPTACYQVSRDEQVFQSFTYQMVYQYLHHLVGNAVSPKAPGKDVASLEILHTLLNGIFNLRDPSWMELHYFISFLFTQLNACEDSIYCDPAIVDDSLTGLSGFKDFVTKFMLKMSVDFTLPSLQSEAALCDDEEFKDRPTLQKDADDILKSYRIVARRNWEANPHPYIVFNKDRTLTFIGFNLQTDHLKKSVNLVDLDGRAIEGGHNIMTRDILHFLTNNRVEVHQNPQDWKKEKILKVLCTVLHTHSQLAEVDYDRFDPDTSYSLTYDNLVKMLAIEMRFRCGIPVVIMGETGCGKTRLIRYMCDLKAELNKLMERDNPVERENFFILKVHGGILENDIVRFVDKVQSHAEENMKHGLDTIAFFDEANTTDAIGLIKEIMCDRRIQGRRIEEDIKFVASCNPYKKHSEKMIENLESAGLGFVARMAETKQKLGSIPLRHLVYRVLDLPRSMKPLVYDYGGLTTETENIYIERIVCNHVQKNAKLHNMAYVIKAMTKVLSWSQDYMRRNKDECSYVSLRDIERCMIVFEWFYEKHDRIRKEALNIDSSAQTSLPSALTLAMLLSIAVCYNSRLIDRHEFEINILKQFEKPFEIPRECQSFKDVVDICQEAFLSNMELGQNIAHNAALKENVFMMAVCVELRIPLFVVGKPGSSKSLAKSTIAESMKGTNSSFEFLREFLPVKMFSYQCSQLSSSESIKDVFRKAQDIQRKLKKSSQTVSLVVLDEVGLAEDSPSLPLKVLHPLLEDGTDESELHKVQIDREERVAFIGISNWALDPAKMNRGIMVRRGDPDVQELVASARGICSNGDHDCIREYLEPMLRLLAIAYIGIIEEQVGGRKEFFGLRDFYSLIKMLYWLIKGNKSLGLYKNQLKYSILRNFGGTIHDFNPIKKFEECFRHPCILEDNSTVPAMDCTPIGLITSSLQTSDTTCHGESRYLLFLTENNAALNVVNSYLFKADSQLPYLLFGSSFPQDKDYTQVCRNINQIKICMETGRTVVLLNLENLYESLYDLLNQYYTRAIGNRYVDLGLQSHRIKCKVHDNFKLILIAEKDKVYDKFPLALINRLEKHVVTISTVLEPKHQATLREFEQWINRFTSVVDRHCFGPKDAFVGFQEDTPAAIVLHACQLLEGQSNSDIFDFCKDLIIQTTCPDALARLRLTGLREEAEEIWDIYFKKQRHFHLSQLITDRVNNLQCEEGLQMGLLMQVTTHSPSLTLCDVSELPEQLKISPKQLLHIDLEGIDSEENFTSRIEKHIANVEDGSAYIIIQCSLGHLNQDLISCARQKVVDLLERLKSPPQEKGDELFAERLIHVVFTVSLPKIPGGSKFISFQGGKWSCVHLDDLKPSDDNALNFYIAMNAPLSKLFHPDFNGVFLHKQLVPCIQAAIANMSQNPDQSSKVKVLQIFLDALSRSEKTVGSGNTTTLYSLLVQIILAIMEREEKDTNLKYIKDWAMHVAMDPHSLQEGGTFMNSLLKYCERYLVAHLSHVIQFVDQHGNLQLYLDGSLREVWLNALANEGIYSSVVLMSQQCEGKAVMHVESKSVHIAVNYTCKFPFSWVIMQFLEEQWKSMPNVQNKDLASIYTAVCSTKIGSYLCEIKESDDMKLSLKYLEDFIDGILQPNFPTECQVLKGYMVFWSDRMMKTLPTLETSYLHRILTFHVVYHDNAQQLLHYGELGRIIPTIHEEINGFLLKIEPHEDIVLDLIAVNIVLRELEPKDVQEKKFWELRNLRNSYIRRLRECQGTIESVLKSQKVVSKEVRCLRSKWQRIKFAEMYIEHLVLPLLEEPDDRLFRKIVKNVKTWAFRSWDMLTRNVDSFSKKKDVEYLMSDILKYVDNGIFDHFKQRGTDRRNSYVSVVDIPPFSESSEITYLHFSTRLKTLFLEVVSVLCFGPGNYESPEPELIKFLMEKVCMISGDHKTTKDLTPFYWEQTDENPVIRTLLLQLILAKHISEDTKVMVESFIKKSQVFFQDDCSPLHNLVVRCIEDKIYQDQAAVPGVHEDLKTLESHIRSTITAYVHCQPHHSSVSSFDWLHNIARLRYCLVAWADFLCSKKDKSQIPALVIAQVFTEELCIERFNDIILYVSKLIVRKNGIKFLQDLIGAGCSFVLPTTLHCKIPDIVLDHLVTFGPAYQKICDSISRSLVECSSEEFRVVLKEISPEEAYCIPLALFSQLAMSTVLEEFTDEIAVVCKGCGLMNDQVTHLCLELLNNDLDGKPRLMTLPSAASDHLLISLVQLTITVLLHKRNESFLRPFICILDCWKNLEHMYLPTMPENVPNREATEESYKYKAHLCGPFYVCLKGHHYMKTQNYECPECDTATELTSLPSNYSSQEFGRLPASTSLSETGYILGSVESRCQSAVSERDLTPVACAIMQFILHSSFLWASCHCSQAELQCLKKAISYPVKDATTFFWDHLKCDFDLIRAEHCSNGEEVAILLSTVLHSIVSKKLPTVEYSVSLSTKIDRHRWEKDFSSHLLGPILSNTEIVIRDVVNDIAKTTNEVDNPLLFAIYEKTEMEPTAKMWAYRHRVTMQSLSGTLALNPNAEASLSLLHKFLMEEPILRALQYLPNIILLQQMLLRRFCFAIGRSEALNDLTLSDVPKMDPSNKGEFRMTLRSLKEAWKLVRGKLLYQLPREYISEMGEIADTLPLAYVLPSCMGPGMCILVLTEYLVAKQNEMLEFCEKSAKYSSLYGKPVVVSELQPIHVIAYKKQMDALLRAHCRYSLRLGEGHRVEYDFIGLEKQIYNQFVVGKPLIDATIPLMMRYTGDVAKHDTFEQIRRKIKPQVSLASFERQEVLTGLKGSLREISECLTVLTIAISFLANAGGSPDKCLSKYIIEVLKLRKTEFCYNYTQAHILSLWETLAIEKARLHSLSGKEVPFDEFDEVKNKEMKKLSPELKEEFKGYLQVFDLASLITTLFRFIQFDLTNVKAEDFEQILSKAILPTISASEHGMKEKLKQLDDAILLRNIMDVWHIVVRYQEDLHEAY